MSSKIIKKDNSSLHEKIALRAKFLPEDARVLDCFCGDGKMFFGAYKGKSQLYHGLDIEKVHTKALCEIADNEKWVKSNDLSGFNVFDLDAYGCPWKLLFLICQKIPEGEYTFFVTDGIVLRAKLSGHPPGTICAFENIPKEFVIPHLFRWYVPIFMTMLRALSERCGLSIGKTYWLKNSELSVYYWAIKVNKQ